MRAVYPHTGNAAVIGFTGPPGAGKSTLIGALTRLRRARDRKIAVLSIDPSSPFTGGAVLGDRIRLHGALPRRRRVHPLDGHARRAGWRREAALQTALLMDAAGRDEIYIETVGVGQAEVDIVDHADTVVLVLVPGLGRLRPGAEGRVMEIPDIIVVNKADHPLTDTLVREIRGVLALGPDAMEGADRAGPRRCAASDRGTGGEALDEHRAYIDAEGTLIQRRRRNLMNEVLGIATFRMRRESRRRCARTPRYRSCSIASCPASSTRRAPRGRSSSTKRSSGRQAAESMKQLDRRSFLARAAAGGLTLAAGAELAPSAVASAVRAACRSGPPIPNSIFRAVRGHVFGRGTPAL